jgi:Domain of unknown function (DUF4286)
MIIHNITYSVSKTIEAEWLAWTRHKYISALKNTGVIAETKLLKLLTEIDNDGVTFTLQNKFLNMEDYISYQNTFAEGLQQKHHERFANHYYCFQTLLEEL